ncbi:MAG: FAD-dependent oxidoreductase [Chloroflexi bacterium]|nr:FAD-dependent oxidoreductase [Chloroflexota bacterium]
MSDIIIIGSGVIGLSAALDSQAAGYQARILTRDLPGATTSMAAGAMWSATDLDGRLRRWAEVSLQRFLPLTEVPGSGVTLQRMREVYPTPMSEPWYRDRIPFFKRMEAQDLPDGMQDGYLMDVPMVAPPIYLEYLQRQFEEAGGRIETRAVSSLDEVADDAPLIVNCSGVGARELAQDEAVYPIRGQTTLVDAPDISLGYMNHDRVDHIFPRSDGVLIGGVKVPWDWNREIDPDVAADILARTVKIEPSIADAKVLRQFSGLRPGRHDVRLEVEELSPSCAVIHNYGHAAIGYTLSWGCAADVVALARGLCG